jgi:hypothetical protein
MGNLSGNSLSRQEKMREFFNEISSLAAETRDCCQGFEKNCASGLATLLTGSPAFPTSLLALIGGEC